MKQMQKPSKKLVCKSYHNTHWPIKQGLYLISFQKKSFSVIGCMTYKPKIIMSLKTLTFKKCHRRMAISQKRTGLLYGSLLYILNIIIYENISALQILQQYLILRKFIIPLNIKHMEACKTKWYNSHLCCNLVIPL